MTQTIAALRTLGARAAARHLERAAARIAQLRPAGAPDAVWNADPCWYGSPALAAALDEITEPLSAAMGRVEDLVLAYTQKHDAGGAETDRPTSRAVRRRK
jgi:hypothetical protein